jgi:hypothetical protein
MIGLSRHSFYATADAVGAGGERPPATRLDFIMPLLIRMIQTIRLKILVSKNEYMEQLY